MNDELKLACELKQDAAREEANWYKHILTISFGSLTLLISLMPAIPDLPAAKFLIIGTWMFLGLSILFGIGATYQPVSLLRKSGNAVAKSIMDGNKNPIIGVNTHWFFSMCRIVMLTSLILAIVCMVAFSITKTLFPNKDLRPAVETSADPGNAQSTKAHPNVLAPNGKALKNN